MHWEEVGLEGAPVHLEMKEAVVTTETVEDLWAARWEVWDAEHGMRAGLDEFRRAEERTDRKKEELPLGEPTVLRQYLGEKKDDLEKIQNKVRQVEAGEQEGEPGVHIRLRRAEKKV